MADFHIDAKNKRLGRLASDVAVVLQGKKSAAYERHRVSNDRVFLTNYRHIALEGRKWSKKVYYRHTGYMGHLKAKRFDEAFRESPENVIRETVRRMLPKNFLNARRLKNLIFVE